MPVFEYGTGEGESKDGIDMSPSEDGVHDVIISDSGSNGQTINRVTIPKAVAEEIGVQPGDSMLTRATDDGRIVFEPLTK